MKTTLSLLLALTLGTAFGQFIPQPMGYNPDVNGDEFIGVDDVMGTLALYDNAFDNGDSTVSIFEMLTDPLDTLWIPENADFVYITADGPENPDFELILPSGIGFKSIVILVKNATDISGSTAYCRIKFQGGCDYDPSGFCELKFLVTPSYKPQRYIAIRGEDGVWYDSSNY